MNRQYWNGYKWVDDPPMARAEPPSALPFDTSDVREALLEAELNPRTVTTEDVPLEVEIECVPEQPTPNLTGHAVERHIDVFSRNPVRRQEFEEIPSVPRAITRDRQEGIVRPHEKVDPDEKVVVDEEIVITDEVRERIRRELGMKDDGGSH